MRGKHQALNEKYQEEVKKREEAENVVVTLYEEKKELEHALDDMIQFLSDYGLEWKGGDALKKGRASRSPSEQSEGAKFDLYEGDFSPVTPRDGEDSPRSQDSGPINFNNTAGKGKKLFNAKEIPHSLKENEEKRRESVGKDKADMKPVDVPLLIRNARILSDYVGYKDNYVEGNRGGIRNRDVVKLAVYANGIVVNNGPFRPFGWPLCDAFLKDLEEGFYPYEFKEKYPSGFPIEVLDKSTEKWEAPKSSAAAAGGRRLGGNVHTLDDDREGKPITKEELLQKLPAQRITEGGKIVNMRADIAKMLGGEADGGSAPVPMGTVKHVSTAENEFRGEKEGANAAKEAGKGEVFVDGLISILLRLPNGQKVTIKMHPSSTILDLRKEFSLAVPEYKNKKYELCQTFPSLTFDDHTKTLESLGFVRSCTLMVRLD
ncbi:hypothetical protein AGDE_11100 [Angomonas deanei]|uniref:UBX domain-containing protein 11 n=1 Tax=Angomonas deanei TaxID=59799 RepID=A0A7G2C1Q3_9TRYP|nr:hypothetical protein AGDE_11100 [Angomonas deanei]CAD2213141.1 SEP domain/UBX domain containing protein, putative [Angomonas deanei]|eukprot:EPY26770.1 hypothetical protein AGDE_11100 [Angomonas deanei]